MFITFEGPEGAGKTTQVNLLAQRLREQGNDVLTTRQPGGDALGKGLRSLLLDRQDFDVDPMTELLMMMADRAQAVSKIILPALESGSAVICDRYTDSSTAYQGYGREIDLEIIAALNDIATVGVAPDITYLLDIDPAAGLRRQAERTRMEEEALPFHLRVRDGYLKIAAADPDRVKVIDASQSIDAVADQIWSVYEAYYRNSA